MTDPQPTEQVDSEEQTSRYLLSPKWFDVPTKSVFAQAFKPTKATPENPVRQTSVYRTKGCQELEIWEIGDEYVTKLHSKRSPVLARADLIANHVLNHGLEIVPHPDPHPRHADIERWPKDEEIEMIIVYLASVATLIPRPIAKP